MAVGVLAILYVLFAASTKPEAQGYARFATGGMTRLTVMDAPPARPSAALIDAEGQTHTLAEYEGEVVLVNLWATWCAPCKVEMPILDDIAGANQGKLRVITISEDGEKNLDKVPPFFAEQKFAHLEPWLDPKQDLSFTMQIGEMPTTFLYNAEGKEIARVTGEYDWQGEEAQALIAEAIGG